MPASASLRDDRPARRGLARSFRLLLLASTLGLGLASNACGGEGAPGKAGKAKGKGGPGGHAAKGGPGGHGGPESKSEEALAVTLTSVESGDIVRAYEASGTLEAILQAEIRSTQSGIIVDLAVEEGDVVKEDDILARLDGREAVLMAKRDELTAKNAQRELEWTGEFQAGSARC